MYKELSSVYYFVNLLIFFRMKESQTMIAQAIQVKVKKSGENWSDASFQKRAELVHIKDKQNRDGIPAGPIWVLKATMKSGNKFVFVLEVETRLLYACPNPIPAYVPVPVGSGVVSGKRTGIVREIAGEKTICWD